MLIDRNYTLPEFLLWTRRNIYLLLVLSIVPVVLYEVVGLKFLTIPFAIVFLLGTTVALSAGFKNLQAYNRMQDAQVLWVTIASTSRAFGIACRDLIPDRMVAKVFVNRHLAWLATLRHEMRKRKPWESTDKAYNVEWRNRYKIPEREQTLNSELLRYLAPDEAAQVLESRNKAYQALALQSADAKRLLDAGALSPVAFAEVQRAMREFQDQQCKTERIKDFPYPRQLAFIHSTFVWILCILLPFGMISEFERLNEMVAGWASGRMVWLAIPLSLLISWMYTSLDQVNEATENPFEGGTNDVPISHMCEQVELDLREVLGEIGLPQAVRTPSGIAM
ncbi:multidrug transporter [Lysobacter sp. A6]|uniref:Multidrug transporter n=1 Tax=Noviluteimonas lactosilytica TaxID=2888523 RepID=A0ABS8JJQ9_9GAMM|nr:bestrophin family ion channel [Lysobacter lactosilyticus]MCC8363735.1 multidrug transporter [Lysobacter lactosilyticus]